MRNMNRYACSSLFFSFFSKFLFSGDLHLLWLRKMGSTQERRFYIWIQVLRRQGPELIAIVMSTHHKKKTTTTRKVSHSCQNQQNDSWSIQTHTHTHSHSFPMLLNFLIASSPFPPWPSVIYYCIKKNIKKFWWNS